MKMQDSPNSPAAMLRQGDPVFITVGGSDNEPPEEYAWIPRRGFVNCYRFKEGEGGTAVKRKLANALAEVSLLLNAHPGIVGKQCTYVEAKKSGPNEYNLKIQS